MTPTPEIGYTGIQTMTRRILFRTDNGPAVVALPVDPVLGDDEIEIYPESAIPEPAISRTKTPQIPTSTLADLVGRSR